MVLANQYLCNESKYISQEKVIYAMFLNAL